MKNKYILLLLCFICLNTFATHIVGGEITYKKLSGNTYKIDMTLFRDCFTGIPPFDNPAFITVFDASGNVVLTRILPLLKDTLVPLTLNTTNCPVDTLSGCVSKGLYSDTITLAPLVGGYTIAYQRCCRAGTILNIANPGATGATYWTHIPGPEVVTNNSSPKFTVTPPFYVIVNQSNIINQSAIDSDGDSLSYFFTNIFDGLSLCCSLIGAGSSCSSTLCPTVNTPPPYVSITYAPGYNATAPVSSSPAMSIQSTTGLISLTPSLIGDYAIGIGIKEYRNHVLIGTYYRDFHMKVFPCGVSAGMNELFDIKFQIFPNPANKQVTINLSNPVKDAYYALTDIFGRIILTKQIENISETLNVSELSKGLYFLKVSSKIENQNRIEKLIIE